MHQIEALQTQMMEKIQADAEREQKRRAEFIDDAAKGQWLQRSSQSADAVWRAASGQR